MVLSSSLVDPVRAAAESEADAEITTVWSVGP
jgi:hypothetical protein